LIDLSTREVDMGQPDDVAGVVMADPEGKEEFCVLAARPPEADRPEDP
jgi:hypothetical protein